MHVDGVNILIFIAWQLLPCGGFRQKSGGNPGIFGSHHSPSVSACSRKYVEQKFVELKRVITFTDLIQLPIVTVGTHIEMQIFFTCLDKPTLRPAGNGNHSRYLEARSAFSVSR